MEGGGGGGDKRRGDTNLKPFFLLTAKTPRVYYRQYIEWIHGRLGHNRRKPVPSCGLKAIREAFPSPDNRYVPFRQ